jgi:cytochrome c oxidase subunit 1
MDTAHAITAETSAITPLLASDRGNGAVLRAGLAYLLAGLGGLAAAVSATTRLSARFLWIVLVIYMVGMSFAILATLLGGFAAGWTVLYPLPTHGLVWSLDAALAMYIGYLFLAIGLLLYAVHVLIAVSRTYGGLGKALALSYLFSFGRDTRYP